MTLGLSLLAIAVGLVIRLWLIATGRSTPEEST
jgi:hypothetical protein